MPLYNTLAEQVPSLVEGKRELTYTLDFSLKPKYSFHDPDPSAPIVVYEDDLNTVKATTSQPIDQEKIDIRNPSTHPNEFIMLNDMRRLDLDHVRPGAAKIRLSQELPHLDIPKEVDLDLVEFYAPQADIRDIHPDFILSALVNARSEIVKSLQSISIKPGQLGHGLRPSMTKLTTTVHIQCDFPPTHIFYIVPNDWRIGKMVNAGKKPRGFFTPVHGLVFAMKCGALPRPEFMCPTSTCFPASEISDDGKEMTLPVVTLALPHPETFQPLFSYLYDPKPSRLFKSLLPTSYQEQHPLMMHDKENLTAYAHYLAATNVPGMIAESVAKVYGFWLNLWTLQVLDEELWFYTRMMWAVLIEALSYSVGEPDVYANFEASNPHAPPHTMRIYPQDMDYSTPSDPYIQWVRDCVNSDWRDFCLGDIGSLFALF